MNHGRKIHSQYSPLPMENVVQLFVPGAEKQPCNILLNKQLRPAVQTDLKATSKKGVKTLFQINFTFQGKPRFKSWQDGHAEFVFFSSLDCFVFLSTQKMMWIAEFCSVSSWVGKFWFQSHIHTGYFLRLCMTFIHTLFFSFQTPRSSFSLLLIQKKSTDHLKGVYLALCL